MSKLSKLSKNPKLFFVDMVKKRMNPAVPNNNKVQEAKPKAGALKVTVKNAQQLLKELTDFAAHFDVNDMKYKGEYIWPYLRQHFWVQLYILGLNNKDGVRVVPERLQLGSHRNLPNYVRNRLKRDYKAYEIEDIPKETDLDFLFLTVINASEQVELDDGSIYHRITDPLYEIAKTVGKAKKFEMLKISSHNISKCNKYKFKADLVLPPSIIKYGYSQNINFHRKFFEILKKLFPSLSFTEENVIQALDWELHTRDYYVEILKKYNPKVLFVNGFHYHAPLLSAAASLGVVTVDIQHGIQVGWNPLYNNWNELPYDGYLSLPEVFLVWGEKEKENIKKVFASERHRPVVGGFPWLTKQLEYMPELKSSVCKTLSRYKKVFLIILQNQAEFPIIYRDLINEVEDDYIWIIRHHPKGKRFTKKDLGVEKNDNILIGKYFDSISLAQLFQYVDICFSEGSTVSLEADYFKVINVISSTEGKDNYAKEIDEGIFFYIDNPLTFIELLESGVFDEERQYVNAFSDVDLKNVLQDLKSDSKVNIVDL